MAELIFPAVATLLLILVAIPAATIVCKLLLAGTRHIRRASTAAGSLRDGGSSASYLLLIAPVLVPTLWLLSAAAHHAEEGEAALTCLFDRVSDSGCIEPLVIATVVSCSLGAVLLWRGRRALREVVRLARSADPGARAKLDEVCASRPQLASIRARIRLVQGDEVRTVGLFWPEIEVGAQIVARLAEPALAAALLHEREHLKGRDPLRFVVVSACQSLNPLSFLLAGELARWRVGREARCDEAAVHHGAEPLALAQALLTAARPRALPSECAAHLNLDSGIEMLRLRVSLLMEYVASPPHCRCRRQWWRLALVAMAVACVLPHWFGTRLIVEVHQGAERVAYSTLAAAPR